MSVAHAHIRAEAHQLRELGWSYRRIARRLQGRYTLGALVAFRLAHGWTQEEAARRWNERWPSSDAARTGKTWSYWESWPAKGGRAPSAAVLWRLAELYLCRPGDLLDGTDFGLLDPGMDADDRAAPVPGAVEPDAGAPRAAAGGGGPGGDEDGCIGLLPLVVEPAGADQPGWPSAAAIEQRLAALVTGWVPAA